MSFFDFLGDFDYSKLLAPAAIGASAYLSSQAAKDAARAQSDSAQASGDATKEMFYRSREDALPYMETGQQSMAALADIYGIPRPDGQGGFTTGKAFTGTPGYGFRLAEGEKAIERAMAAGGMRNSGARLKALQEHGQNVASDEWGNYTNALRNLAGLGQVSTSNTQSASGQAAGQIGNAMMAGGAARASGYAGGATAINQGLGNALSWYGNPFRPGR